MIKILISACLLGYTVRYDGRRIQTIDNMLNQWHKNKMLLPFCPEVAGGLPVPRLPAEIEKGDGNSVLKRDARVINNSGLDVTDCFIKGAQKALEEIQTNGIIIAILKDGSPSCGSSYIYDGSFSGVRKTGSGVAAALLENNGINVFGEHEIQKAVDCLDLFLKKNKEIHI